MKTKILSALTACLAVLFYSSQAFSNVTIIGTRVIYPATVKEVTIRLHNRGDRPALVQAWIDDGNQDQALDKINVPFVLLPPVFRMEANKGQTLRVVFTGSDLPQDRESIYWLNVLDIPPKEKSLSNRNQLQMAIRSRIKLFYRPERLDEKGANEAARALTWQKSGNKDQLLAFNNSPYYITVSEVVINEQDGKSITNKEGEMLPPHGKAVFTMNNMMSGNLKSTLRYSYLDDSGAARKVEGNLQQ